MGVCCGEYCVLLLAILIYWHGMRNPTIAQAAGTLWFTSSQRCNQSYNDTSSPVPSNNQLQLTVEPQYCTYSLQAHYKPELEAFHCQFLKYTERFLLHVVLGVWMQSEMFFLTLCTHDHYVSDCCIEMCGRERKVVLSCTKLRNDFSTANWILIHKYSQMEGCEFGSVLCRWNFSLI